MPTNISTVSVAFEGSLSSLIPFACIPQTYIPPRLRAAVGDVFNELRLLMMYVWTFRLRFNINIVLPSCTNCGNLKLLEQGYALNAEPSFGQENDS